MASASASRLDKQTEFARELAQKLAPQLGGNLVEALLAAKQDNEAEIAAQRERVCELRLRLQKLTAPEAPILHVLADALVKKSVWIVGGDGWAYDIGFGGLDHVIAMNAKVNILVLDTEVYSNTGGQQSKATPRGASARFAVAGKRTGRKDLGLMAMTYGTAYVAQVAFGSKDSQTVKAFEEAESYPGTSLIIAYGPCIEHGYALGLGLEQQKLAVDTGFWPLYRFDPRRLAAGEPGLKLDSADSQGSAGKILGLRTPFPGPRRQGSRPPQSNLGRRPAGGLGQIRPLRPDGRQTRGPRRRAAGGANSINVTEFTTPNSTIVEIWRRFCYSPAQCRWF